MTAWFRSRLLLDRWQPIQSLQNHSVSSKIYEEEPTKIWWNKIDITEKKIFSYKLGNHFFVTCDPLVYSEYIDLFPEEQSPQEPVCSSLDSWVTPPWGRDGWSKNIQLISVQPVHSYLYHWVPTPEWGVTNTCYSSRENWYDDLLQFLITAEVTFLSEWKK